MSIERKTISTEPPPLIQKPSAPIYTDADDFKNDYSTQAVTPSTKAEILDSAPKFERKPSVVRIDSKKVYGLNGNATEINEVITNNPTANPTDIAAQATSAVTALSTLYGLYNQYKGQTNANEHVESVANGDHPHPTISHSAPLSTPPSQYTNAPITPANVSTENNQKSGIFNEILSMSQSNPEMLTQLLGQAGTAYNTIHTAMNNGITHINTSTISAEQLQQAEQQRRIDEDTGYGHEPCDLPQPHSPPQAQTQSIDLQSIMTLLGSLLNTPTPTQSAINTNTATNATGASTLTNSTNSTTSGLSNQFQHNNPTSTTNNTTTSIDSPNSGTSSNLTNLISLVSTLGPLLASATSQSGNQNQSQQALQQSSGASATPGLVATLGSLASGIFSQQQSTQQQQQLQHDVNLQQAGNDQGLTNTLDNLGRGIHGLSQLSRMFGK